MAILTGHGSRRSATAVVTWLTLAVSLCAQSPGPIEAELKAVFLFNFAKYVTWREPNAGNGGTDIRVCTTANDAFFAMVKSALEGEAIDGRPLVAVALDGLDEARSCHILYVGDASTADARAWFGAVRNGDVLTVADGKVSDEPAIAFVRDQNRLRFDINRASASRHHLTISSKLLRLARSVQER
jgi:hypothetical protein